MKHQFLLKALFASGLVAASAQLACSAESSDPYPNGGGNRPGTGATGGTPTGAGGDPTGAGGSVGTGGTPTGTGGTPTGAGGTPATGGAPPGGAAGTVGAGGTTGGTGSMTCAPQVGSATDLVISDLEAGTNAINAPRTGYWFSFGDGTGTMPPAGTPFAPEAGGSSASSMYYAHFTCTGGKYVGMGFDLNNCNMKPNPYDVSAYTGVSFAYKSSHDFKFMVGSVATTLPADGGTCSPEPDCRNHHATVIPASAAWTTIQVPFNTLIQDFGVVAALDKTKVLQLQFQVSGVWNEMTEDTDPITPAAVDLSIDDVSFY